MLQLHITDIVSRFEMKFDYANPSFSVILVEKG